MLGIQKVIQQEKIVKNNWNVWIKNACYNDDIYFWYLSKDLLKVVKLLKQYCDTHV